MADTPLDDEEALAAVQCLLDAVVKEIKPGVQELRLAANTLRALLEEPTADKYSLATKAFDAIDFETRQRISGNAHALAINQMTKSRQQPAFHSLFQAARGEDARPVAQTARAPAQASSLLQALNFGARPSATKKA